VNVRVIRASIVLVTLILVGAGWAQAESSKVQIKFKFVAAGKMLEAGNYTVEVADGGKVILTPEKGAAVELSEVKKLGHRKVSKAELIFDEAGLTRYLSEVWVPGSDGVKVGGSDSAEERVSVTGKDTK
jgi:hypothetical protein